MKKISTGLIALCLIVLSGCSPNTVETEYADGSNSSLEITLKTGYQAHYGSFDYAFAYPENYVLDSQVANENDAFLESLFLFDQSYLDWNGPEGHPGINVYVFAMSEGKELTQVAEAQHTYTNYSIATGFQDGISENGYDYLSYSSEGLYPFDYYLIEYGDYLYVFTGYDNSEEASERTDIKDIVDSLIFVELDETNALDDLIVLNEPLEGDDASCPLRVSGEARGYWYFEATFPYDLLDESGDLIASGSTSAIGDWMTEDFVPFEFDIFYITDQENGTLILKRSNASGLPENDMQLEIDVLLTTCSEVTLLEHKRGLVQDYIRKNIVELSPVEATLGGTWHVLEVEFLAGEIVHVTFEDGHIQKSFDSSYSLDANGNVELSF